MYHQKNLWVNPPRGFVPTCAKLPKTFQCLLHICCPLSNVLNLNLPCWLIIFLAPHSLLISALFSVTTLLHVLYVLPIPICCRFLMSVQLLPPVVSASLPPQFGTFSLLPSIIPLQRTLSVAFWRLTTSSRPSAPPSGSPKCLRFGHWPTLCTINIYLLTYLLTISNKELCSYRYVAMISIKCISGQQTHLWRRKHACMKIKKSKNANASKWHPIPSKHNAPIEAAHTIFASRLFWSHQ